MKIRTDFVTNSSSSSYVIIGKDVAGSDVSDLLKKGKRIMASIPDPYEGGIILFDWDKNMQKSYNRLSVDDPMISKIDFYMADFVAYDDRDGIELPEIKKGSKLYCGRTSINTPSNFKEIVDIIGGEE